MNTLLKALSVCAVLISTLPAHAEKVLEAALDTNLVAEGTLPIMLRLQSGEELLFAIDTGSPVTLLDHSLNRKLGRKSSGRFELTAWEIKARASVYPAPILFFNNTPLITGSNVLTVNFRKFSTNPRIRGILGMDSLRHYCIQCDFSAGKIRFLPPGDHSFESGERFPLALSHAGQSGPEYVRTFTAHAPLISSTGTNLLVDTGLDADGALLPAILRQEAARPRSSSRKLRDHRWNFASCEWEGNAYTNLVIREASEHVADGANVLGLRFLSRHLMTFDFPNRVMYLERRSAEPLKTENERFLEQLLPLNGELPPEIDQRIGLLLARKHPPFWFKWFGGRITLQKAGETSRWIYLVKKTRDKQWHVKKAWRASESGQVLETIPLPAE